MSNKKPLYSLPWLISPIEPKDFLNNFWENKVLVIKRKKEKYWNKLISKEIIDNIISSSLNLKEGDIILANAKNENENTKYVLKDDYIDIIELIQRYREGSTIILNSLHKRLLSLSNLCRGVEKDLSMPCQANVYLTPSKSQGFKPHYDSHCVFILQVSGSKSWKIYDKLISYPTKDYRNLDELNYDNRKPTLEFQLNSGDIAYIPRGFVHEALTNKEESLHITLGVLSYTWVDILPEILKSLCLSDADFRKSLPTGFANPEFHKIEAFNIYSKLSKKMSSISVFENAFNSMVDKFISTRKPILNGQLLNIQNTLNLSNDKVFTQRANIIYQIKETKSLIQIYCYGKKISFPTNLKESILFSLNTKFYKISDIPGGIDYELKRIIVRQLVENGLVWVKN